MNILHIDSSARRTDSVTRELSTRLVERLDGDVTYRDLATPLPAIDEQWIGANFTPAEKRDAAMQDTLALSDQLVAELQAAETIVIGTPIYNFSVPTALRGWIDLVARAGLTFRYTADGPEGLLSGKRAIIVVASGGTKTGSEIDFATSYLTHVLGFIGITDVTVVAADQMAVDPETTMQAAKASIDALAA